MPLRNIISTQTMRTAGRVAVPRAAPLSTTSGRLGLKESSSQTDVDYDKHKADSVAKAKRGDAQWKAELASDSEEAIKADQTPSGPGEMARLQEQAKKAAEAEKRGGS